MTTNTKQGKLTDEEILDLAQDFRHVENATSYEPYETFDALGFARAIEQRTAEPFAMEGVAQHIEDAFWATVKELGVKFCAKAIAQASQQAYAAPVEPVSDALPVVAELVVAIEHEDYDNTKPAFTYTGISAIYREAEALPLGRHKLTDHAQATAEIAKRDAVVDELLKERTEAKRFVIAKHGNKGSASILRLALRELHQELDILRAELAKQTGVQELVEALKAISLSGMSLPMAAGGGEDREQKMRFHSSQAWKFIAIATNALAKYKGANNGQ